MVATYPSPELAPWHPTPTELPEKWKELADTLALKAKGSPHRYVLNVRYDAQRTGDRLRSWGLPWQVVMAGYLWEYEEEQIRHGNLNDVDEVLGHIDEANVYARYIEDENLPPLLTPPYRDLGALLIAAAIYYQILQTLQEQSIDQSFLITTQPHLEHIGHTLLNIATRLGMWHFKHEIEDLSEQLRSPLKFSEAQQEHIRILKQDAYMLEDTRQLLIATYQQATQQPISVTYTECGITGMKRRKQDAHTTATSQKAQLTGFDLVTFDIMVPTVQDCYSVVGILSQLGQIQDRITDQIANPKANGCSHIAMGLILKPQLPYSQSLRWLEANTHICQVQIATHLMQSINWYGCLYPGCYQLYMRRHREEEIEPLSVEKLWNTKEGKVFLTIKEAIFTGPAQLDSKAPIVVYDKNHRPVPLPKEATALDFAYALSNEIGKHAVDALINNRKAPLYRTLNASDIVEIRTSEEIQVQAYWATYTTTPEAHRQITESLSRRSPNRKGYTLLLRELERYYYMLPPASLDEELGLLVEQYGLGTLQEYLEQLDEKAEPPYSIKWAAQEIMHQITERNEPLSTSLGRHSWIPKADMQLAANKKPPQQRLCSSCRPTHPRDMNIMGRLRKRGSELIVHKESCPHLIGSHDGPRSTLVPMIWQLQPSAFRVAFFILAEDRLGLILDLTRQLHRHQCNLLSINGNADTLKSSEARILFTIEVHTDSEVLDICQELYKIESVKQVEIDAAATPIHIYDRLQKQRKQREAIPDNETFELPISWIESAESMVIQQRRNIVLENPFDISRPATSKMFFGRSTETATMQRELCGGKEGKALILYGPLRSGKSSICKNFLERYVQSPFWSALFSLQNVEPPFEESILKQLAEKITNAFSEQLWQPGPDWQDYQDPDPEVRFRHLLQDCMGRIPGTRLILALDEFGGAFESYEQHMLEYRFFSYWKELMNDVPQLSLILVLPMSSHRLLTSKKFVNVFSFAQHLPMSFLDRNSAQQLLVDPLREQSITIHPNTIALALKLTGGNPYYMTLIGQQLIHYLNREIHQLLVTDTDLRLVIDQIIERGSSQNFDFLGRELQSITEGHILEAIVELTSRTKQMKVQLKKIAAELTLAEATVRRHLDRLRIGLLLDENGPSANPYYSLKIDLVRRWLTRNRWFFSSLPQK